VRFLSIVVILMLVNAASPCKAQALETVLDSFLSQNFTEAKKSAARPPEFSTIADWSARHPGETIESPGERSRDDGSLSARNLQDREREGRWCLRSSANIDLPDGVRVRRTVLFYQPLVEQIYNKPLPPLPTEDGDSLRQHGCRLTRILSEFELPVGMNPGDFADTLAKRLPGKRSEEPGRFVESSSPKDFWKPLYFFSGRSSFIVFTHAFADHPAVLLEWKAGTLDYGQPSSDAVNPEAGHPWLPSRAALIARLPEAPTLEMLSFLAPQVGDWREQPPLFCNRELAPVLRNWFALAAKATPERHAAALLVADAVAGRLSDCDEFSDTEENVPPQSGMPPEGTDEDLRKSLAELGIKTEKSARPGPEYYTGNLIAQVRKLAPGGVVNELSWIATLDQRCQWSATIDSNCMDFIQSGEAFLLRFPADEWTPSVHLLLAEAYSITAVEESEEAAPTSEKAAENPELLTKAAAHYRAWYATSTNERDRALVWEEIWGIEAGLGPRLMVPEQLRQ
jgi:hypothetical protein